MLRDMSFVRDKSKGSQFSRSAHSPRAVRRGNSKVGVAFTNNHTHRFSLVIVTSFETKAGSSVQVT